MCREQGLKSVEKGKSEFLSTYMEQNEIWLELDRIFRLGCDLVNEITSPRFHVIVGPILSSIKVSAASKAMDSRGYGNGSGSPW